MSSVCRVCLVGNTRLYSVKNNMLRNFYEKLINKQVTHYITEVNPNMKQHLSVATMPFITIDVNATNVESEKTIEEEPLPTDIDIKEEVAAVPDTLLEDQENDMEELPSNTRINQSSFTIKGEPLPSFDIKNEVTEKLDELVETEFFPAHSTKNRLTFEEDYSDLEKDVEEEHLYEINFEQNKPDDTEMAYSCNNLRTNTGEKRFTCNRCDKKFSRKYHLIRHMGIHMQENPFVFVCNECEKQFTLKQNIVRHMRIHTAVKLFACNVCDKQFHQKGDLVVHMRVHSGEKPFACNVCDKKFNRKYRLSVHMRTHTGKYLGIWL